MVYSVGKKRGIGSARVGFTLIELMIAILIGALVVGGGVYWGYTYLQSAKRSSTRTTLQNLKVQLMSYQAEKGEYPPTLQAMVTANFLKPPLPKDGWGVDFVYRPTPDGPNPYELFSHGPEGRGGGKEGRISAWGKK